MKEKIKEIIDSIKVSLDKLKEFSRISKKYPKSHRFYREKSFDIIKEFSGLKLMIENDKQIIKSAYLQDLLSLFDRIIHNRDYDINKVSEEIELKLQKFEVFGDDNLKEVDVEENNKATDYFKLLKIHPEILKSSKKLFENKHYSQAIFEAFKKVNILVKEKSGRRDLDGKALMQQVFSVNSPILKFNELVSISDKDEQEGFMYLYAGAIQGVRNPKGHEEIVQKDPIRTMEYLIFASLLCKLLETTKES